MLAIAAAALFLSPLASALTTLEAMDVYAITPASTSATVYQQGSANAVQWTIANAGSANTSNIVSMDVWLGTGTGNVVNNLYQIKTLPYPATTCFEWTPASNLTAADNYTIIWQGLDSKGTLLSYNFCTWFKIGAAASSDVVPTCPAGSIGSAAPAVQTTLAPATTGAPVGSASGNIAASVSTATTSSKSSGMGLEIAASVAVLAAFLF
ncbi:hypothetical protein CcCBS67573_g01718 [Chytriomyces confervae]|uniref:Uncharacterized protein n=1 Tax=Chytriomyces confervae TaxID=246404 RepID=A0A507FMU5_9FUNG|nr:hypothetical protein HDU80_008124 [Chytriomyces hyalinus]TPX77040.1 hypothetical protein CcCBS67573_g01718 [Chytriomyces confervae]